MHAEIVKEFPTFLSANNSLIQKLDSTETNQQLPFTYKSTLAKVSDLNVAVATLKEIVGLANAVIDQTDVNALLIYYGMKTDNRLDATKIKT